MSTTRYLIVDGYYSVQVWKESWGFTYYAGLACDLKGISIKCTLSRKGLEWDTREQIPKDQLVVIQNTILVDACALRLRGCV